MKTPHYPFLDLQKLNAPYMRDIEEAVSKVVTSGRYIGGEECERFEENLRIHTEAPYAVGVSNGLDALRLILRAWVDRGDISKGDEVIVASNTYIASILAIIDAGLCPVLAPVDMSTLNLDTARLEESLTPRTRVIMPVHLYGRACWDSQLKEFAEKNQLLVIEDNAQGIGARTTTSGLMGTHVTGGLGHAGAFSFYPTKNIGAMGDAGAIVTHDSDLAARVKALSNYGSDRRYHNIYLGGNCRLDPVQAAVLNVKLKDVDLISEQRRVIARIYDEMICHKDIEKPILGGEDMVWHQYVVRSKRRDQLQEYLSAAGVATDVHYATPHHQQPCMAGVEYVAVADALLQAEEIGGSVLSLPISACTSESDAREIAAIINQFQ